MEKERVSKPPLTLMTIVTWQRLKGELGKAEQSLRKANLEVGEAAGPTHDWHDNFGYDQAMRDSHMSSLRVKDLREKISSAEFIKPREDIRDIEIGNTVHILFEHEDEVEEFTLLGPEDTATNKNWISFTSPLGSRLIGGKLGELLEYNVNGREFRVTIAGIFPGRFE
ncbi:hypothetical protein CMO96_00710 [Candidatus Woesebacteria bacterium]|nr:hypothetical protein [Candidatus Woesebacteria bacterium]